MKKLAAVFLATSFTSGMSFAATPECEIQSDVAWMEQIAFEERVQSMGYTIENLAVSDGNCYQLTGQKNGQGVVAFFNPQTGDVVQEVIAQ